jgi:rare lipoprotein A
VVQSGDTLSGIAAELGTTVEDLAAANGLADPDLLYAGQTLSF